MKSLLHKLGEKVRGVIEGFDRIVFKGRLKPFCYSGGFSSLDFLIKTSAIIEDNARTLTRESGVEDIT